MGDPNTSFLSPETADELARSLIAAFFWIVHLLAIRRDAQLTEPHGRSVTDAALADQRREALRHRIEVLESELADAKRQLAHLDEVSEEP
jgi:hypothetical protein